jgi:HEAT repeat protein
MKNIGTQLAAVAMTLAMAAPAIAGHGGSNDRIQAAIASGSQDSIVAEVERAEGLMCEACVTTMLSLTQDSRYRVREVAGWWFARRPGSANILAQEFIAELGSADSTQVRNAADFLGAAARVDALPALAAAYARGGMTADARFAIVHAAGVMASPTGNALLASAMSDADAGVRAQAVVAWRDVLGQTNATPVEPLLGDSDAGVRAVAATVLGAYKDARVLGALEQIVVSDASPLVRRNAAWALGQIGSVGATAALTQAVQAKSGLVRNYARVALGLLH